MIIERVPQPPRKNASGWREEPRSGVEAIPKAEDGDEPRQDPSPLSKRDENTHIEGDADIQA